MSNKNQYLDQINLTNDSDSESHYSDNDEEEEKEEKEPQEKKKVFKNRTKELSFHLPKTPDYFPSIQEPYFYKFWQRFLDGKNVYSGANTGNNTNYQLSLDDIIFKKGEKYIQQKHHSALAVILHPDSPYSIIAFHAIGSMKTSLAMTLVDIYLKESWNDVLVKRLKRIPKMPTHRLICIFLNANIKRTFQEHYFKSASILEEYKEIFENKDGKLRKQLSLLRAFKPYDVKLFLEAVEQLELTSNDTILIDEAHLLADPDDGDKIEKKRLYYKLYCVLFDLKVNSKVKFVLLTATPLRKKEHRLGALLNLVAHTPNFPTRETAHLYKSMFDMETMRSTENDLLLEKKWMDTYSEKKMDQFANAIKGLISYIDFSNQDTIYAQKETEIVVGQINDAQKVAEYIDNAADKMNGPLWDKKLEKNKSTNKNVYKILDEETKKLFLPKQVEVISNNYLTWKLKKVTSVVDLYCKNMEKDILNNEKYNQAKSEEEVLKKELTIVQKIDTEMFMSTPDLEIWFEFVSIISNIVCTFILKGFVIHCKDEDQKGILSNFLYVGSMNTVDFDLILNLIRKLWKKSPFNTISFSSIKNEDYKKYLLLSKEKIRRKESNDEQNDDESDSDEDENDEEEDEDDDDDDDKNEQPQDKLNNLKVSDLASYKEVKLLTPIIKQIVIQNGNEYSSKLKKIQSGMFRAQILKYMKLLFSQSKPLKADVLFSSLKKFVSENKKKSSDQLSNLILKAKQILNLKLEIGHIDFTFINTYVVKKIYEIFDPKITNIFKYHCEECRKDSITEFLTATVKTLNSTLASTTSILNQNARFVQYETLFKGKEKETIETIMLDNHISYTTVIRTNLDKSLWSESAFKLEFKQPSHLLSKGMLKKMNNVFQTEKMEEFVENMSNIQRLDDAKHWVYTSQVGFLPTLSNYLSSNKVNFTQFGKYKPDTENPNTIIYAAKRLSMIKADWAKWLTKNYKPITFASLMEHSDENESYVTHKNGFIIDKFNDSNNADGSKLSMLVGGPLYKESVTFKNVKYVHILEPQGSIADLEQAIGRTVRVLAHDSYPFVVKVFIYTSKLSPEMQLLFGDIHTLDTFYVSLNESQQDYRNLIYRSLRQAAIDCMSNSKITGQNRDLCITDYQNPPLDNTIGDLKEIEPKNTNESLEHLKDVKDNPIENPPHKRWIYVPESNYNKQTLRCFPENPKDLNILNFDAGISNEPVIYEDQLDNIPKWIKELLKKSTGGIHHTNKSAEIRSTIRDKFSDDFFEKNVINSDYVNSIYPPKKLEIDQLKSFQIFILEAWKIYDKLVFNNQLKKYMNQIQKVLNIELQCSSKGAFATTSHINEQRQVTITFNLWLIFNYYKSSIPENGKTYFAGCEYKTISEIILLLFEHEICHLIAFIGAQDYNSFNKGHSPFFCRLLSNLFNHNEYTVTDNCEKEHCHVYPTQININDKVEVCTNISNSTYKDAIITGINAFHSFVNLVVNNSDKNIKAVFYKNTTTENVVEIKTAHMNQLEIKNVSIHLLRRNAKGKVNKLIMSMHVVPDKVIIQRSAVSLQFNSDYCN